VNRLNKDFDRVVCINLAERRDKRENMQKKLDRLEISVEWFTAVQYGFIPRIIDPIVNSHVGHFNKTQPYEIGAALSHYTVIKQALLSGCETLVVFEDDVKFHNDFNEKLDNYLDDVPNWDMLMFYSFMYKLLPENERISKRWIRSYNAWSLMAYAMNRYMMEEYIKKQDEFFTIADSVTYKIQEDKNFSIYSAIPSLCIPETELGSNIRGQNLNYKYNPTIVNLGYNDDNYK
jgi:GR25 family glycosyltransferase involved in LPS biosynthesis